MAFQKRIRSLDIFTKVPSEISRATNLGGAVSLLTIAAIFYLLYAELHSYTHPEYVAEISNDKMFTREQMTINLDITFPAFPCQIISLDLEDVMVSHHPNIGSVEKWRLSRNGSYIDSRGYELLREPNPIKQLQQVRQAFKNGHGCRLIGSFTVKEVPGNFHVSCHAYYNHYAQTKMQGHAPAQLNMSHTINKLYFGKEHHIAKLKQLHPQAQIHLLQNVSASQMTNRSYNYHVDIVPTWYHQGTLNNYYTYQYTYHRNPFKVKGPAIIHFNYHIGGLGVQVLPRDQDFWRFTIHLCALIGGAFAICKAVYNWVSNMMPKFQYQLIQ